MPNFRYFGVIARFLPVCIWVCIWVCDCLLSKVSSFAANLLPAHEESSVRRYHDLADCRSIIACKAPDDLNAPNQLSLLASRAIPNERLFQAFGIDNSFTTQDIAYSKEFRAVAASKLRIDDQTWKDIARVAEQILHNEVQVSYETRMRIHLIPLLQLFSLKIALNVLFHEDPFALNDEVVSSLARTINALWILSKESSPNKREMESLQDNLHRDLESLLPAHSSTPRETPMNFIIPAYETLWRVVLHCFIEVAFRHPSSKPAWRSVLAAYLAKPTAAQFLHRHSLTPEKTVPISAEYLAKEGLRLYPPTRRIYRTLQLLSDQFKLAADIECLHRDPIFWGADSSMYVPARWASASQEARSAWFAFGGNEMVCPAKHGFGPRMVALLLAALVGEFGTGEWVLEVDEATEEGLKGEVKQQEEKEDPEQKHGQEECSHQNGDTRSSSRTLSEIMDPKHPLDSSRQAHTSLFLRREKSLIHE